MSEAFKTPTGYTLAPALSLAPAPPTGALQADPQIPATSGIQHESNVPPLSQQIGGSAHEVKKRNPPSSLVETGDKQREAAQYKEGTAASARQQAIAALTTKVDSKDRRGFDKAPGTTTVSQLQIGLRSEVSEEDLTGTRKFYEIQIAKYVETVEESLASAAAALAEYRSLEAKARDLENQARKLEIESVSGQPPASVASLH
ncbi:hypothetical protein F5878DRAFT_658409 [Lentinula raphanica]|uniref:Uncharacterized protein n=1 Tax=Lentinula raphanica TaxID=153919 RepID=A0AA38PER5_9AGAR|nr:hypothetical protein F5878DRAFT_658409 [Lentinula raphanica]